MKRSADKVHHLKLLLQDHSTMLIVMQDHPDPDSIAAACALRKLANTLSGVQCSIAYGGTIGRGENRALVSYLGLNLRDMRQVDLTQFELVALVDTQPGSGNNSLPGQVEPDIVIDHHRCRPLTRHCRFTDIRSRYGSTATILFEYLQAARIKPEMPLATALLYGIRSDTQDLGRDAVHADIRALIHLYPFVNKRMLGEIQRGKVHREYYQVLADALRNTRIVDNAAITNLGQVTNADMIAEVADLLLRDDSTDWVMAYGLVADKLLISLRTSREDLPADKLIRSLVARKGTGGGHPSYAGGQIVVAGMTEKGKARLIRRIIDRFVKQAVTDPSKSQALIRS